VNQLLRFVLAHPVIAAHAAVSGAKLAVMIAAAEWEGPAVVFEVDTTPKWGTWVRGGSA
jgi:hypothetical protein